MSLFGLAYTAKQSKRVDAVPRSWKGQECVLSLQRQSQHSITVFWMLSCVFRDTILYLEKMWVVSTLWKLQGIFIKSAIEHLRSSKPWETLFIENYLNLPQDSQISRAPFWGMLVVLLSVPDRPIVGLMTLTARQSKSSLSSKCRGSGVARMPPFATCFSLWAFWLILFEPVGNFLLMQGKLLSVFNLLFSIKYFPKARFFALPPPTLGSVARTINAWKFRSW